MEIREIIQAVFQYGRYNNYGWTFYMGIRSG